MAKRPKGGRPPGRSRPAGGIGPGPGYRPNPYSGGKKAGGRSSSSVRGPVAVLVYSLAAFVVLTGTGVTGFLLHGYGVI